MEVVISVSMVLIVLAWVVSIRVKGKMTLILWNLLMIWQKVSDIKLKTKFNRTLEALSINKKDWIFLKLWLCNLNKNNKQSRIYWEITGRSNHQHQQRSQQPNKKQNKNKTSFPSCMVLSNNQEYTHNHFWLLNSKMRITRIVRKQLYRVWM